MKKLVLVTVVAGAVSAAGLANAADLGRRPVYKAPPAVALVPTFNWIGLYLGGHLGYGWGPTSNAMSGDANIGEFLITGHHIVPASLSTNRTGVLGGAQIGYNYQLGAIVVGLEADIAGADLTDKSSAILSRTFGDNTLAFQTSLETKNNWVGTARGRVGFLPFERLLVYFTGGAAFGDTHEKLVFANISNTPIQFKGGPIPTLICPANATCLAGSSSQTALGGTVGGGFEYAITRNVSVKSEYLFVDLGHHSVTARGTQAGTTPDVFLRSSVDYKEHIVRFGVNYRFDWSGIGKGKGPTPVVARY
jgi:outer membrane immunogenic protein